MADSFKQDMPPRAGYGPIEWAKKIPKKGIPGVAQFTGFLGITGVFWVFWIMGEQRVKREDLEMIDSRVALEPLMLAEKHRMMLRQFRRNRDEENDLMKDVPGWETGKLDNQPIYHNLRGRFLWPTWYEYYSHNSWWDMYDRQFEKANH